MSASSLWTTNRPTAPARSPTTWDEQAIRSLRSAGRYDEAIAVLEPLYVQAVDPRAPETLLTGHWLALVEADAGRLPEHQDTD